MLKLKGHIDYPPNLHHVPLSLSFRTLRIRTLSLEPIEINERRPKPMLPMTKLNTVTTQVARGKLRDQCA